jgi:hypothetical protein
MISITVAPLSDNDIIQPSRAANINTGKAMYHGSRNESFSFFPAICFTESQSAAAAYGGNVTEVEIDRSKLNILAIEMTAEELRDAIDSQEWPCDRQRDIDARIAEGYTAVAYTDCDENGQAHDCIRILAAEAFAAAVKVV